MAGTTFIYIAKHRWQPPPGRLSAVSRGLALCLGAFTLLNLLGELRSPGFDGNLWWIDLRFLPPGIARSVLLLAGLCLIVYALSPTLVPWRRRLTLAVSAVLVCITLLNAFTYKLLLADRTLAAGPPVPFSLLVTAALLVISLPLLCGAVAGNDRLSLRWLLTTVLAALVVFPLAQIYCFGKADYRRPADAIVVFGACAYADGSCSLALYDRVLTACSLYHDGYGRCSSSPAGRARAPCTKPRPCAAWPSARACQTKRSSWTATAWTPAPPCATPCPSSGSGASAASSPSASSTTCRASK